MLKIGITGGIGSGKTTVCRIFQSLGIPVLYADEVNAILLEEDAWLKARIVAAFGEAVLDDQGKISRKKLGARVFAKPEELKQLESWIHPRVIRYSQDWFSRQQAPYAMKEAALFFEAGTAADMDLIVGIRAPQHLRLQRTQARDGVTEETVRHRMAQQMDEEEKLRRCDLVLINDGSRALIPQVLELDALWRASCSASASSASSASSTSSSPESEDSRS